MSVAYRGGVNKDSAVRGDNVDWQLTIVLRGARRCLIDPTRSAEKKKISFLLFNQF